LRHFSIGILCFFVGVAVGHKALSQTTSELVERIESAQVGQCQPLPGDVDALVEKLRSDTSEDSRFTILEFLASLREWRSSKHNAALGTVSKLSRDENPLLALLAARATIRADGELVDIITSIKSHSEVVKLLVSIGDVNLRKKNRLISAFSYYTAGRVDLERTFELIGTRKIPLDDPEIEVEASRLSQSAIRNIEKGSAILSDLYNNDRYGSRDFSFDSQYIIALLKFVTGIDDWDNDLSDIILASGSEVAYVDETNFRHVLVNRFLQPPNITPVTTDVSSCASEKSILKDSASRFGRDVINKLFNPFQLANYTCNLLNEDNQFSSIASLIWRLSEFENSDYRVVVGHYRGERVRFSHLNREEVNEAARLVAQEIGYEVDEFPISRNFSDCAPQSPDRFTRSANTVAEQKTGDDSGYIYIGSGLSFDEASELLEAIRSLSRNFRGAYLIRPSTG
jgi:hypothetical protein